MSRHASWDFGEGAEVAPGRTVLKTIGGGSRYEVYLVWDESLFALGVAKLLRPDQVEDEKALRDLGREAPGQCGEGGHGGNSGPGGGEDDDHDDSVTAKTDDTSANGHLTRGTTDDNDTRTCTQSPERARRQRIRHRPPSGGANVGCARND